MSSLTVHINDDLSEDLRTQAFNSRMSKSEIVREALEEYFSTRGNNDPLFYFKRVDEEGEIVGYFPARGFKKGDSLDGLYIHVGNEIRSCDVIHHPFKKEGAV